MYIQSINPNRWTKIKNETNYHTAIIEAKEILEKAEQRNIELPFIFTTSNNIDILFTGSYDSYGMYILFGDVPQEVSEYEFDHNGAKVNKELYDIQTIKRYNKSLQILKPRQKRQQVSQQQDPYHGYQHQDPYHGYQHQDPYHGYQHQNPYHGYQQQDPYHGYQHQDPYHGYQQPIQPSKFPPELLELHKRYEASQKRLDKYKMDDAEIPMKREDTQEFVQNGGQYIKYKINKYKDKLNNTTNIIKKNIYKHKIVFYNNITK